MRRVRQRYLQQHLPKMRHRKEPHVPMRAYMQPWGSMPTYEQYEAQIKACFARWPAAAKFYQSLIHHLHTATSSGWSSLQKPTTFLLGQSTGRSDRSKTGSTTSLGSDHSNSSSISSPSPTPASRTEQIRLGRHPHITVVEGFLAPETIGILGEWHRIRPEFFIDNLAPSKSCTYGSEQNAEAGRCELPLLPSQRENIIHVRFFSQLKLPNKGWKAQAAEALSTSPVSRLDRRRHQLETKRREYEQQLFDHRQYGVTRFRALHIHNEQSVTVEQMVSFTVKKESDKVWHGLFILDGGREFQRIDLPWAEYIETGADTDDHGAGFVPTVPYNLRVPDDESAAPQTPTKHYSPYHPGPDILSVAASSGVDAQLLVEDPFYILSCVYQAAACSRVQILDSIESEIAEYLAARGEEQNQVSEQLHRSLQLVRRVELFSIEDLTNINKLGSGQWPRTQQKVELELIRGKLRGDYECILEKCTSITLQCERTSNALVGLAQREESRAGVRESRNVANLTMLALLFIPLNYISSLFSMNVTPITEGVPIWYWAVPSGISALVTGIAIAVLWWKRTHRTKFDRQPPYDNDPNAPAKTPRYEL
ncbi:hypothetical protein QBC34DRAFT_483410 [Podospora aff. communis PSN243]|uniref:Uncharacterized protein n=1 Tax=Podospora aff. communis PSN243 TaxID=3040156 RepID=A0AAV9GUP2_9PEZI|nr:hypothetical protein QBC34DRAFT_483410 [Podospora aff. communis PSN243]